jgi:hypothetical protein
MIAASQLQGSAVLHMLLKFLLLAGRLAAAAQGRLQQSCQGLLMFSTACLGSIVS